MNVNIEQLREMSHQAHEKAKWLREEMESGDEERIEQAKILILVDACNRIPVIIENAAQSGQNSALVFSILCVGDNSITNDCLERVESCCRNAGLTVTHKRREIERKGEMTHLAFVTIGFCYDVVVSW